jgi:hypothetical protein
VGKLLSGSPTWREDPALGRTLVYHALNKASSHLGLVVVPSSQTFDAQPQLEDVSVGKLLQVDLRLHVPLSEALASPAAGHSANEA